MKPFDLTATGKKFCNTFPEAETLRLSLSEFNQYEINGFIHLWFMEGIPFAFKDTPLLYAQIKTYLAHLLDVIPRNITMVGSGRTGFSMAPKSYGKEFSPESDLDFSIVSEKLFNACHDNFLAWKKDVESGNISPKNSTERNYWQENLKNLPNNFKSGFVDPHMIPAINKYKKICQILNTKYCLSKKIEETECAPKVKKISIRVYKDFYASFERLKMTLSFLSKKE